MGESCSHLRLESRPLSSEGTESTSVLCLWRAMCLCVGSVLGSFKLGQGRTALNWYNPGCRYVKNKGLERELGSSDWSRVAI